MKTRFWLFLGVLGLAGLAVACGSTPAAGAPTVGAQPAPALPGASAPGRTGIVVSGQGRASAKPDIALLNLGVSTRGATVGEAHRQAQEALDRLVASLRDNGIEERDIQTRSLSITPEYAPRVLPIGGEPRIIGYRFNQTLTVKVRKLESAGKVVDDAVRAAGDASRIQGIRFALEDPTAQRQQARDKAMADAKAKAEQLAARAGVVLGKPIFITEGGVPRPVILERALPMPAPAIGADLETPISPGELEVVVTVNATFAIQ